MLRRNRIDSLVLRDALKCDVRDGLIVEAMFGVQWLTRVSAGLRIASLVCVKGCSQQTLPRNCCCDPRTIDCHPAPTELFRYDGSRSTTARRIQNEIAWFSSH